MKMDRLVKKSVRPILLFIVIVFVVSCFFMYGTGGGRSNAAQTQEGEGYLQDYDVVVINGEAVKRSRLDMEVERFIREMGLQGNASSTDYPAFRNTVIDQIAILKELDKEITSRKIAVGKDELDQRIADIKSQFPTAEIYLQQLQAEGFADEEGLRKAVEEEMKRNTLFEEVSGVVSTDEAELRNYYDMIKTYAFSKPEGFLMDVAHFKTPEAAETARGELSSGTNWDDVMAAASDDVTDHSDSANRMFIPENQLGAETESLKALSMDIPSEVISFTSDDNMIVVKRSREAASTASFDEVSADIEQMVLSQKRTSLQSQFMQELRTKADVKILDEELFKMAAPETPQDDAASDDSTLDSTVSPDAAASGDN
ncbi:MAG: SurA N-terminal domain-containing protein [Synergistaceae bacterium]|jgi:hypothetical protein|nr:SurA N-terminal domain-containing protein [Synergistaceae bacterium]